MTLFQRAVRSIWPVPKSDEELNPPQIFDSYEKALASIKLTHDPSLSLVIGGLSKELIDQTADRRNHIESRASATINIAGVSLALLGGLATLFGNNSPGLPIWFFIVALTFILVALTYLLGSILIAVQVYGRIMRATLDPNDLVPEQNETADSYSLRIGARRIAYAIYNYRANNRAVGFVYAAQRRLQFGIAILLIVGSLVVVGEATKRNRAEPAENHRTGQPVAPEPLPKTTSPKSSTVPPSASAPLNPMSPSSKPKGG